MQAENEDLKRNSRGGSGGYSGDYEKALSKIDLLLKDNEALKRENQSYYMSVENYKAQLSSLERAKNR